jgi:hypothetical protein
MKERNSCVEDSSKSQVQEKERKALKSFIADEAQEGWRVLNTEREYPFGC